MVCIQHTTCAILKNIYLYRQIIRGYKNKRIIGDNIPVSIEEVYEYLAFETELHGYISEQSLQ